VKIIAASTPTSILARFEIGAIIVFKWFDTQLVNFIHFRASDILAKIVTMCDGTLVMAITSSTAYRKNRSKVTLKTPNSTDTDRIAVHRSLTPFDNFYTKPQQRSQK
jgi:uncharacterized protein (DUF39 family)